MSSSVAFNVIVNWPTSDLSLHFHNAVSLDLHKNVFKPVPLIAAPSALFTIFKSFYRKRNDAIQPLFFDDVAPLEEGHNLLEERNLAKTLDCI